jgi:hypothetical protein
MVIMKETDTVVMALLADLYRFQERYKIKNPTKACVILVATN